MILELIADALGWFVNSILGLFFALIPPPPPWAVTGLQAAADVWQLLLGFETWIPITLALQAATVVVAIWLIGMAIGVVRVIVSYLTLGGGAT